MAFVTVPTARSLHIRTARATCKIGATRAMRRRAAARALRCTADGGTAVMETEDSGVRAPDAVVAAAHAAADAAGAVLRGYFRSGELCARLKADATPVTAADTAAEAAMRAVLQDAFPEHAVLGEEGGGAALAALTTAEWAWVLDPIDGTKAFVAGRPTFGTLIAVLHHGEPVFGLIDQPVSRERWTGGVDRPTQLNGTPMRVRPRAPLAACAVHATTPDMFIGLDGVSFRAVKRAARSAVYGADCYAYALLASGHVDLVVEADLKPWDFLALAPVVEGAGGYMTDWYGDSIGPECDGRVVAAASQDVLCEVLEVISEALEPQDPVDPGLGHVEAMSGFVSAKESDGTNTVFVEISAQYHDDCEVVINAPTSFDLYRPDLASLVQHETLRGLIKVSISVSNDAHVEHADVAFDESVLWRARELLDKYAAIARVDSKPTIEDVFNLADRISSNTFSVHEKPPPERELVWRAVKSALSALHSARRKAAVSIEFDVLKRIAEVELITGSLKERLEGARSEGLSPTWDDEVKKIEAHTHLISVGFMGMDGAIGGRLNLLAREVSVCARALASQAHDAPVAHHAILIEEQARELRALARRLR